MRAAAGLLLAVWAAAWAAGLRADTTLDSAYLLRGISPQEDALGGGALTVYGGAEAQWDNPAALAGAGDLDFALTQEFSPLGGNAEYAAGSMALGAAGRQHLGVQIYYQGQTDTYRDALGQVGASFTNMDSLVGLSYAYELNAWSFGAGLKVLSQSLAGQAAQPGVMADLGVTYLAEPDVLLSAAARNLGSVPQYAAGVSPYRPETFEFGAREDLQPGAVGARLYQFLGVDTPNDAALSLGGLSPLAATGGTEMYYGIGADYTLGTTLPVVLRVGYSSSSGNPGFPYGLSAGLGVSWESLQFNYAVSDLGELGLANRLSLNWAPSVPDWMKPAATPTAAETGRP